MVQKKHKHRLKRRVRLVRMARLVRKLRLEGKVLTDQTIIVGNIPGARYHDGGRLAFGPDGMLYITTGDATDSNLAQDTESLAGKILRVYDDGSVPEDNPFGNEMYSYGHRNPQGIVWDELGQLWATEHGRSGVRSGLDELNLIKAGQNYGWPDIEGDATADGKITPVLHSGANATWAPAGIVYWDASLFFAGLRGEALYEYNLVTKEFKLHFREEFGRIRAVVMGPDDRIYWTLSEYVN